MLTIDRLIAYEAKVNSLVSENADLKAKLQAVQPNIMAPEVVAKVETIVDNLLGPEVTAQPEPNLNLP